jgi:hypothetical protein
MEYLTGHIDESDRLYQSLLDISNAAWPDVTRAAAAARNTRRGANVTRVLNIRIKLETQPAR